MMTMTSTVVCYLDAAVYPEVTGESNPGAESPSTGWAEVGVC